MKTTSRKLLWNAAAVIASGLLAVAAAYFYTKTQRDRQMTAYLARATARLEQIDRRDPYPNEENLHAAASEEKRVRDFVADVSAHFGTNALPQLANNREFRIYLDTTIGRLQTDARRSGVEVPANYWFTFAAQKGATQFAPKSLSQLSLQLAEISTLCDVLFDAKVNSLAWLKRVPVDSLDVLGSPDYLSTRPMTNQWAVVVPYEVAFQGFSSELAAVLERLARLPQCFVVTNLVVEPSGNSIIPADTVAFQRLLPPAHDGPGLPPDFRQSFLRPHTPTVRPILRPSGSNTVLAEQPLRFVLSIQAVRLL